MQINHYSIPASQKYNDLLVKDHIINSSTLTKDNLNFFYKHGFIVVKNIIKKKDIHLVAESIELNLYKYLKKSKISKSKDIHESLSNLRKKNKKFFSYLFDSLQTMNFNYNIMTNYKVQNLVSKLLNVQSNLITLTDVALRLDPPVDTSNTLGWHQDSSYFRQNNSGRNGVVLWTPINKLTKKHGFLEFLDESHNLGSLNVKKQSNKKKFSSSKRNIDKKTILNFKKNISFDLNLGDALLMNLDIVHRSGNNISNQFRMSLLGRFHNMISDDFNSGLSIYRYSNKKLEKEIHG